MTFAADAGAVGQAADDKITALQSALDAASGQVTALAQENTALQAQVTAATAQHTTDAATIADLTARLAVDEAILHPAPPPPPPPPPTMRLGVSAGSSATSEAAAKAKWPKAQILRVFTGDDTYLDPYTTGCLAWSNKPNLTKWNSGGYDAAEKAWAAKVHAIGMKAYRIVWHEPDVKLNAGTLPGTFADWLAAQNHLAALYAGDTLITPAVVVSSWTVLNPTKAGLTWLQFLPPSIKSIGIDLDGSRITKLPYVDYKPTLTAVAAFKKANPGVEVRGPEFGAPLITGGDANGTIRAGWITSTTADAKAAGLSALVVFDYTPEGPLVPGSPEFAAWQAAGG